MQGSILICYSYTIELILFCLLWAHFSYWRHFISSCIPLGWQSSIEPHRCIFISWISFPKNALLSKNTFFSFNGDMGKPRNLTKGQGKPQIKINPRPPFNSWAMSEVEALGAWGHLWPDVMLETPLSPLLTAMGLLSHSSLTDQGSSAAPFGFVVVLAVQHCLLFWDSRNRYLNIDKKKNSCRQEL